MAQQARRLGRSNLPAELTSFVGRRQQLREVKRLLTVTRLLTLTGSGGAGKTRLALHAAADMSRGFPDGAWLVSLASILAVGTEDRPPSRLAPAAKPGPRTVLTDRQLDIARLVADDLSNSEIAARLFLSERTVETHITNIFSKLGLNSRIQLSRWVADAAKPD